MFDQINDPHPKERGVLHQISGMGRGGGSAHNKEIDPIGSKVLYKWAVRMM